MITIKAKFDTNGTANPDKECKLTFGNYFDGVNYHYFESDQEREDFYISKNIDTTE